MVEIKEKERSIIEFTCIPEVSIEQAQKLYEIGFKHLSEFLEFTLDDDAKDKGLLPVLNHRILSHYLSLDDQTVPSRHFKCPFCMDTVYADEEECQGCGALLLEEILEVEIEGVYQGLRDMISAVIDNPESAKPFLEGLQKDPGESPAGEVEPPAEEATPQPDLSRGFTVATIPPLDSGNTYLMVISPLGEHDQERDRLFTDLEEMGMDEQMDYPIEDGNITNLQEDAVENLFAEHIMNQDYAALGVENFFLLNIKIARFWESKATITVEDNRHFMSSMEEIRSDDDIIMAASKMLYDADLIRDIRKTGENFVMDMFGFNNDPISFLLVKECLPVMKEHPEISFRLLDVVVNTDYIEAGSHNDLVRLLLQWKEEE